MTEPARWSAAWRKHNVNLALQISCVLLMRFMSPLHAARTAVHNHRICHAPCLFITRQQGAKNYIGMMVSLGIIRHHPLTISTSCTVDSSPLSSYSVTSTLVTFPASHFHNSELSVTIFASHLWRDVQESNLRPAA